MAILHLLILGALGLVGGTLSGLAGVGGAMVFVPALMLGVRLRDLTPDIIIRRGFPVIMIFIAVRMLVDASAVLR